MAGLTVMELMERANRCHQWRARRWGGDGRLDIQLIRTERALVAAASRIVAA